MWEALPASPAALAVGIVVTAAAALLQGTIGFGFAVLSVPVLALVDPALAPVPQLLMALPLTLSMAWRERHALELRGALWVLIGRVPGALLGLGLLKIADERLLDAAIGLCVLIAVAVLATGARVRRTSFTELASGIASGIMGLISAIGGPPTALLYRDAPGATVRSTLAVIFSVGLTLTIATRALGGEIAPSDIRLAVLLLPALLGGLWLSGRFAGRIEGRPLRIGILLVCSLAAIGLLIRALLA